MTIQRVYWHSSASKSYLVQIQLRLVKTTTTHHDNNCARALLVKYFYKECSFLHTASQHQHTINQVSNFPKLECGDAFLVQNSHTAHPRTKLPLPLRYAVSKTMWQRGTHHKEQQNQRLARRNFLPDYSRPRINFTGITGKTKEEKKNQYITGHNTSVIFRCTSISLLPRINSWEATG